MRIFFQKATFTYTFVSEGIVKKCCFLIKVHINAESFIVQRELV